MSEQSETRTLHVWLVTDYENPGPPVVFSDEESAKSYVESLEKTYFNNNHLGWQESDKDHERYYVQPKWEEHPWYVVECVRFMNPEEMIAYDD